MRPNTLTLPFADAEDVRVAARFIAELIRHGIVFKSEVDIGPNIARTDSVRVLVITFTGGF